VGYEDGDHRDVHQLRPQGALEGLATPFTYRVVAFLKRVEHEDYYDRDTDFTPFRLAVD